MRRPIVEEWSRRDSVLHRREERVKVLALLAFLVGVALARPAAWAALAAFALLLGAGTVLARLPLPAIWRQAALVLPFSCALATVAWLGGDHDRAGSLVVRSFLSAWAVVLLMATTPLPCVLGALARMGAPRLLVQMIQLLARYLMVVREEARQMRQAALSRGGLRFGAAAGAVASLFGRSHARAEAVHRAALARGGGEAVTVPAHSVALPADLAFLAACVALILAVGLGLGR